MKSVGAHCLTLKRVEFVDVDAGLVTEQQHQYGQTDGGFGSSDGQDEKHKNLARHVVQVVGKRHEIHVDRQQHQLNRHEQHDQVLAVQKNTNDRQRKQHAAQRKKMSQAQYHDCFSSAAAMAAGAATTDCILTMVSRSP